MSTINGIIGFNKKRSSFNQILAAYGNDVVNLSNGLGYGLNLDSSLNVEFSVFLDNVFLQNYDVLKTFNGVSWSNFHVGRCMAAKYLKPVKSRMYLGNCKFTAPQIPQDNDGNDIVFPSRVFHSDFFLGGELTWGTEWGQNGAVLANTHIFEVQNTSPLVQDFKARNIKVGDPLFITRGSQLLTTKPYTVTAIDSPYRLIVDETFPISATGLHFWVGRNWFDVGGDDNDEIMGLGKNSNRLIPFKLFSLYYYTGNQLVEVNDSYGTPSSRSILNKKGYTYFFHGSDPKLSGIYRFDGVTTVKVSRALDPYFAGMSDSNFPFVVGWIEGDELRWYLGDISNPNYDIEIDNAVATVNLNTNAWDVSPIGDAITCSTQFKQGSSLFSFCGTSDDEVLKMGIGYSFNGDPINLSCITKVYYPSGSDVINEYVMLQAIGRSCRGVRLLYKLWDDKDGLVDDQWHRLGEMQTDKNEFKFTASHKNASGVQFAIEEGSVLENDFLVEKLHLFYRPISKRL